MMRTLWQVFQHKPVARADVHLLSSFAREKSEEAFADLVHRHGGMVLGVCRRILGHTQDAEDAFQATFLVLARRAGSLHGNSPLGPWLYGVARRVSQKARARRPQQSPLDIADHPDAAVEANTMATSLEWSELGPIIDDEIAQLPGHYQQVLILCQINGLTKTEAGRQLGCPEGTISSRLMRAKELLRDRLQRRGVTLASLTMIDVILAASPVSAQLSQATVGLAMKVALGASLTADASSTVLSLAQGATHAMFITKLKVAALGLALVTGLSLGTTYVAGGWGQEKGQSAKNKPSSAIKPSDAVGGGAKSAGGTEKRANIPQHDSMSALLELNKVDASLATAFQEEKTLEDGLAYIERQTGLSCIVDTAAFRTVFAEFDQRILREQLVKLPRMTNQSNSTILHALFDTLLYEKQSVPSTFLMRRGTIVIVPKDYVVQAANLIHVAFDGNDGMDLLQALDRLSQDTGVSIILDPRAKALAGDAKVTTSFRNLKLINAVKLLANMADLAVINIDGALYVATPENCKKMEDEMSKDVVVR